MEKTLSEKFCQNIDIRELYRLTQSREKPYELLDRFLAYGLEQGEFIKRNTALYEAICRKPDLSDQVHYAVTVNNQSELEVVLAYFKVFNPTHMLVRNGGKLGIGDEYGVHISLNSGYLSRKMTEHTANKFSCTIISFEKFNEINQSYTKEKELLEAKKLIDDLNWQVDQLKGRYSLGSGLYDKNGDEIYNNDFLRGDNSVGYQVYIEKGMFRGKVIEYFLGDPDQHGVTYPLNEFQMSSIQIERRNNDTWIDVKDRLPGFNEEVLLCEHKMNKRLPIFYLGMLDYSIEKNKVVWFIDGIEHDKRVNSQDMLTITHWSLLPAPPKTI